MGNTISGNPVQMQADADEFAGFRGSSYWPQVRELLTKIWGEMVLEAAHTDGPGAAGILTAHDRAQGAQMVLRRVVLAVERQEADCGADEAVKFKDEASMKKFMLAQMRGV